MKNFNHSQKVLNLLRYNYNLISPKWNQETIKSFDRFSNLYFIKIKEKSNQQWDFINSTYYYITNIDKIFYNEKETYIDFLENKRKFYYENKNLKLDNYEFRKKKKYQKSNLKFKKETTYKDKDKQYRKLKKTKHRSYTKFNSKYYVKNFNKQERVDIKKALKGKDWQAYSRIYYYESEISNGWISDYKHNIWDNFQEKDRKKFVDPNDWW